MICCLALQLLASLVGAAPAHADRWIIECADCARTFYPMGDRSLRLDSAGHPRIAYGGDHLYYAQHDGTAWRYETADQSPDVGLGATLALDAAGRPTVSYFDVKNKDLKLAFRGASGWQVQVVDSQGVVGAQSSLALDESGYAHIAYTDDSPGLHGALKYAYQDGAGWHIETVDSKLWLYSANVSMALDGDGHPHISYRAPNKKETFQVLKYATHDELGWHIEVVDETPEVGEFSSLALDTGGYPHVSYFDKTNRRLKYAHWQGAEWHLEVVDSATTWGSYTSLVFAKDGTPQIGYVERPNSATYEIRYANRDAGGWHVVTAVSGEEMAWSPSLAIDADGHAHIGFIDSYDSFPKRYNRTLKVAHRGTDAWQVETVDKEGNPGSFGALALDRQGRPHISYNDLHDLRLVYTRRTRSGWKTETVPTEGRLAIDISLALDGRGNPHLGYSLGFDGYVPFYSYRDDTGWHNEAVVSTTGGCYGPHPSLTLAQDDTPRMGYFDCQDGTLKFAYRDEVGWHSEVVEGAEDGMIYDVSLALDNEGQPSMSFYDSNHNAIQYASRDEKGWHLETVENRDEHGWDSHTTSLALDEDGNPHVAYWGLAGAENSGLRYAYKSGTNWHRETVESGGNVGSYVSLSLDQNSRAHIAYFFGYPENDLKYAYQGAAGWQIQRVDTEGDVGRYPSLALDEDGQPHVSYRDDTRFGLKYAYAWAPSHFAYLPLLKRR